ncbi:MAG: TetR/AcrR family transcriptional regulator, partial [Parvularculaceae bacterium]
MTNSVDMQQAEPSGTPEAPPLDETARRILAAASKRFHHYGYGKTTMSEIAGDCNMSTGNLYRYFPSKLDIAEAFARQLRRHQIAELVKAAAEPDLSPEERLRHVLKTKFRLAYHRWHNNPKAYELTQEILTERPHFAVEWEAAEGEVLAGVLEQGAAAGVFETCDQVRRARIVQDAVFRFTSPAVFHEGEYEILSRELHEVISVLLDGFAFRAQGGARPK